MNQNHLLGDSNIAKAEVEIALQPEHRLLLDVAGGDERAFAELYQIFSTKIFNYLLNLVYDDAVAEDLLQDVFVAVWNGAKGFRGSSQVKTWIFHIAHNQAVSWFRRNRKNLNIEDARELASDLDLESQVMDHWRRDQIAKALRRLTPEHREVVELAFIYELSYQEIAEVIGCPVGTVKSRMSYARRYLTHELRQLGLGRQNTGKAGTG